MTTNRPSKPFPPASVCSATDADYEDDVVAPAPEPSREHYSPRPLPPVPAKGSSYYSSHSETVETKTAPPEVTAFSPPYPAPRQDVRTASDAMAKYIADDAVIIQVAGLRTVIRRDTAWSGTTPPNYTLEWSYKGQYFSQAYRLAHERDQIFYRLRTALLAMNSPKPPYRPWAGGGTH